MGANISIPKITLRALAATVKSLLPTKSRQVFWFSGDAATVKFTLPRGWKPYAAFNAGSRVKEGSGDEYTVTSEGTLYSVVFAVAPANLNDISVDGVSL